MKYLLSPKCASSGKSPSEVGVCNGPLSKMGGPNALGIGFRIWVKSRFNDSQLAAINAAAREYGGGGFTLVKGPPGTGKVSTFCSQLWWLKLNRCILINIFLAFDIMEKKTTTLVALLNALHSRQYQRYYSEIERITLAESENSMAGKLCFSLHKLNKVK